MERVCFVPSSKKFAVKPLRRCCTASFVYLALLRFWLAKNVFMCKNTRFRWKVDCPKVSLLNYSRTHFVPCHGNLCCRFWTTDTISSHPSSNTWKIWLWISATWTFCILKSHITNCASEEVGFSIFVLVSNEGQLVTLHYARTVFTWTTGTASARVTCAAAIRHRFLHSGCASYV